MFIKIIYWLCIFCLTVICLRFNYEIDMQQKEVVAQNQLLTSMVQLDTTFVSNIQMQNKNIKFLISR